MEGDAAGLPGDSGHDTLSATRVGHPPDVSIDSTTELRWFLDGPLPDEVVSWFTNGGSNGLVENRRDAYLLDGQVDVGVKRRHEAILEVKLRHGPPEAFHSAGLEGWVEHWQRWSPGDHLVEPRPSSSWLDVDKQVVKRRFDCDGQEVPLTEETRAMTGQGCDVEIASVSVGHRSAWTFAFAAFGPAETRPGSIGAAWRALALEQPLLVPLAPPQAVSCGYPQWLVSTNGS